MGFRTTVGSDDPSSLFIVIPPEMVAALSEKKRPPMRVTLNGGYTYRSTVAVYGRRYPPYIRHGLTLTWPWRSGCSPFTSRR